MACLVLVSYPAKSKIELDFAFLEGDLGFYRGMLWTPNGPPFGELHAADNLVRTSPGEAKSQMWVC